MAASFIWMLWHMWKSVDEAWILSPVSVLVVIFLSYNYLIFGVVILRSLVLVLLQLEKKWWPNWLFWPGFFTKLKGYIHYFPSWVLNLERKVYITISEYAQQSLDFQNCKRLAWALGSEQRTQDLKEYIKWKTKVCYRNMGHQLSKYGYDCYFF